MNIREIFSISDEHSFNDLALRIFHYQYQYVSVYREFVSYQNIDINKIDHYTKIPFLPIEFFKSHRIISDEFEEQIIFQSSGTTGSDRSKHFIADPNIYKQSFLSSFNYFFGDSANYCFLALLPSYLENPGSSLIYMTDHLIKNSKYKESGFFNNVDQTFDDVIQKVKSKKIPCILLGVSFALLDFPEDTDCDFKDFIVMETGGMKGRKKELTREELHLLLGKKFGIKQIHSEYGMTELLSQSYSKANGLFFSPSWKKILIRDINDPKTILPHSHSGGINIIDLANIYSCSFIATQDLGKKHKDDSFEVLGRYDHSDIRGCNLMSF